VNEAGARWEAVYDGSPLEASVIRAALDAAGFTVAGLGQSDQYSGLAFDHGRIYVPADQAAAAKEFVDNPESG
jgi:hypothetical protein